MSDLTGRVALVTGATRGLGRAMVEALARAGADVVVSSRKQDACDDAARAIAEETGRRALPVACHVGRWSDVDRLAGAAYEEFGRVDVLVNNAGMSPLYDSPATLSEELWDKVLDVNLKGAFRLGALVGERMRSAGSGSIVNMSSIAAVRVTADVIPYAAAKAGLNAVTKGLAQAFAPDVRVNAIQCGPFHSDATGTWDMQAFQERADRHYAMRRMARTEEIVGTLMYLATDQSSFTTGSIIRVDGGRL